MKGSSSSSSSGNNNSSNSSRRGAPSVRHHTSIRDFPVDLLKALAEVREEEEEEGGGGKEGLATADIPLLPSSSRSTGKGKAPRTAAEKPLRRRSGLEVFLKTRKARALSRNF